MEPERQQEYIASASTSGGARRHYAYTAVLPRSGIPARSEREVEMSDASSSYAAAIAASSNPSRPSRSHYYDE